MAVGFATGATTANVAGLAAARHAQLAKVGWDVEQDGLAGGPPVRVIVGADSHASVHWRFGTSDSAPRNASMSRPGPYAR